MSRYYAERIRLKCSANYSELAIFNSFMTVWGRGIQLLLIVGTVVVVFLAIFIACECDGDILGERS